MDSALENCGDVGVSSWWSGEEELVAKESEEATEDGRKSSRKRKGVKD